MSNIYGEVGIYWKEFHDSSFQEDVKALEADAGCQWAENISDMGVCMV